MDEQQTADQLTAKQQTTANYSSCPLCKRQLAVIEIPKYTPVTDDNGRVMFLKSSRLAPETCPCVLAQMEIDKATAKAQERQNHINGIIASAGTSGRLAGASFENWRRSPDTEDAYNKAIQCAADIVEGKTDCGLILLGSAGNGKSHLAESIGKRIAQSFKTYVFKSVPELMLDIRSSFGRPDAETHIMHTLTTCDLLVMDDIGAEKWSEWTEERLYLIIDARYRRQLNIVATTNAPDMPALKKLMGNRTYDRLLEMCAWAVNNGDSQRRRAQAERLKR